MTASSRRRFLPGAAAFSGMAIAAVVVATLPVPMMAQAPPGGAPVEEIVILRSLRLSRSKPTEFCAPARTGFPPATSEDRYDFLAVATDAGSGKVTSASGPRAGTLHACFGPSSEPGIASFYAEGEVGAMPLVGRGQCRTTKRDYPETGITVMTCQLDLTGSAGRVRRRSAHHQYPGIARVAGSANRSARLHAAVDCHRPAVAEALAFASPARHVTEVK